MSACCRDYEGRIAVGAIMIVSLLLAAFFGGCYAAHRLYLAIAGVFARSKNGST